MVTSGGPDIVNDGLVLHLDAADRKSYSGSGTAWYDLVRSDTVCTLNNGPIFSDNNRGKITVDASNDSISLGSLTLDGSDSDKEWTYEVWLKPQPVKNNIYRICGLTGGSGYNGGWLFYYEPFVSTSTIYEDSNGKVYIAGYSKGWGANTSPYLARFNSDGTFDDTFDVGSGPSYLVYKILPTSNNKLYIAGYFNTYNGVARSIVARINSDGSIDTTFNNTAGLNNGAIGVTEDSSGNLYVSGTWTIPVSNKYLIKLDSSGNRIASFNTGAKFNNTVRYTWLSDDESTLFCIGNFTSYNGQSHGGIIALNTSDASVNTNYDFGTGFNSTPTKQVVTNDGIYICGYFTSYNGTTANRIVRLDPSDFSIDTNFNTGTGLNNSATELDVDSSGNVYVGGGFTSYNGVTRTRIVKIDSSGSIQAGFNFINNYVNNVAVGSSRVYYGGIFNNYVNGQYYNGFDTLKLSDGSRDTTFFDNVGQNDHFMRIRFMHNTQVISTNGNVQISWYPYLNGQILTYDEYGDLGFVNRWQHITITKRAHSVYIYSNGQLFYTDNNYGASYKADCAISYFNINSELSQIRAYDRGLSSEEILQNYNATKGRYGL